MQIIGGPANQVTLAGNGRGRELVRFQFCQNEGINLVIGPGVITQFRNCAFLNGLKRPEAILILHLFRGQQRANKYQYADTEGNPKTTFRGDGTMSPGHTGNFLGVIEKKAVPERTLIFIR